MRRSIAVVAILALLAPTPAALAEGSSPTTQRRAEPGRHKWVGLTVGLVTGLLYGAYGAAKITEGSYQPGVTIALWTLFAAGGAVGGYAIAGGFKGNADIALEEGRAAVRNAEAARAAAQQNAALTPLPNLRLSTIPGLEDLNSSAVSEVSGVVALAGRIEASGPLSDSMVR